MLSDAALKIAIGCDIKWLYNSSRRLAHPVDRSTADATWWRLVHHLAVDLGIPLADAARSADTLLTVGMVPGRVRLRATRDDSVAITVDLARFRDGAALAAAAAVYLAVPKTRGRPPRTPDRNTGPAFSASEMETIVRLRSLSAPERLTRAMGVDAPVVLGILSRLASAGVPCVIAGNTAAAFHGAPWLSEGIDLCVEASPRHAAAVVRLLNELGAIPRGIAVRDGFRIDPAILGDIPVLALRAEGVALNLFSSIEGIGEFAQVEQSSEPISIDGFAVRVVDLNGSLRSAAHFPVGGDAPLRERWLRFASSANSQPGTR